MKLHLHTSTPLQPLGRTFPNKESAEQYAARFPLAWVTPVCDYGYHVTVADTATLAKLGLITKAARVPKASK